MRFYFTCNKKDWNIVEGHIQSLYCHFLTGENISKYKHYKIQRKANKPEYSFFQRHQHMENMNKLALRYQRWV